MKTPTTVAKILVLSILRLMFHAVSPMQMRTNLKRNDIFHRCEYNDICQYKKHYQGAMYSCFTVNENVFLILNKLNIVCKHTID